MTLRRRFVLGVPLALGLTACDKLGLGGLGRTEGFKGVDITGSDFRFALPDVEGRMRTPDDFKGQVAAVFFGYTQCPDVCPTALAELAQVKKSLGSDGSRLQAVFITVDPERDTPQVLKAYVANFDPGFVALRGTLEQTRQAAQSFKVFFAKAPGKTPDSYSIDHTAGTYLFDPKGRVRVFERYGGGPGDLTADVKALLAGA